LYLYIVHGRHLATLHLKVLILNVDSSIVDIVSVLLVGMGK